MKGTKINLQLQDLSDAEFAIMHESVLRLLSEYGVLFEEARARALLTKAGNQVDREGRVHLKPEFVESMLALVPRDGFTMYGRDESKTLRVVVDEISFRPSTGAPLVLDYATRRSREATMDDARMMATLTDGLDGFDMVNSVVTPADAPGSMANVHRFINAHRHALKPSDITVMTGQEVNAIAQVAAAIRGGEKDLREKPLTAVDVAMITPLRCAREQVEALMACAKWRLPIEVLTSPAMAVSAPITLAGSAALAMAEVIAALCLVYLIAPGLGIINTARISPTNMRTTAYNYGAPELGMGSVLVGACSARYRIPSNLYGFGTVAKVADAQAAMEKTFPALLMALGRPHMITGGGILDNGLITSPEQLVIDHEAIRFIKRIRQPITIDEESIGIDVLKNGMASDGCLLAEEHTVKHLRAGEMVDCSLEQWCSYSQWEEEGAPDLFDRAHRKVEEILASHTVAPFDADVEKAIDRIVKATS